MQVIEGGVWYNVSVKEDGTKFWYHNNQLHREKGPAIEHPDGKGVWYFKGEATDCKSQKEFDTKIVKNAKTLQYYDVKVETMLPATLTYKVLAGSPEEAFEKARQSTPQGVKHRLAGKRDIKAMIYETGSAMVKLVKNLAGR